MTVTRVPASNPEPDDDGGLDGRGTWSAADLPASAWQATRAPLENGSPDLGLPTPVSRTLCLKLSDDRVMPLQCRFRAGHADECDWDREPTVLTETRTKVLLEEQGTPSDVLPVRTPGAVLAEGDIAGVAGDVWADDGGEEPAEVSTPSGRLPRVARREVVETWTA